MQEEDPGGGRRNPYDFSNDPGFGFGFGFGFGSSGSGPNQRNREQPATEETEPTDQPGEGSGSVTTPRVTTPVVQIDNLTDLDTLIPIAKKTYFSFMGVPKETAPPPGKASPGPKGESLAEKIKKMKKLRDKWETAKSKAARKEAKAAPKAKNKNEAPPPPKTRSPPISAKVSTEVGVGKAAPKQLAVEKAAPKQMEVSTPSQVSTPSLAERQAVLVERHENLMMTLTPGQAEMERISYERWNERQADRALIVRHEEEIQTLQRRQDTLAKCVLGLDATVTAMREANQRSDQYLISVGAKVFSTRTRSRSKTRPIPPPPPPPPPW